MIKHKFTGEAKAEMVLEEHEKDFETYETQLKKLIEACADKNVKPEESAANKYKIECQSVVKAAEVGGRNKQENTFN